MAELRFYGANPSKPGWFLSNFSHHPILVSGKLFPTTEHYFQYMKFSETDIEWAEAIRNTKTPLEAKRLGSSRDHDLHPRWDKIRDDVMLNALRAKCEQHADVKTGLLGTGSAVLIEASPYDWYWGCGANGRGKNKLGLLLMRLREDMS
jgi:ribA/ribD-fused uncharacterized protein